MEKTDIDRKLFQQTSHTGLLIAFLTPLALAEDYRVIAYAEMAQIGHEDDPQKLHHYLRTARLRILRDQDKWFRTEPGVGIKLATPSERAGIKRDVRDYIGRAARRGRERGAVVDTSKLTNSQLLAYLADDAILCLHEKTSRTIVSKRLAAEFEKSGPKSLEAQELMRLAGIKQID